MRKYSVIGLVMVNHGTHRGEQIETAEFKARNGMNAMKRASRSWRRLGQITQISVSPLNESKRRARRVKAG